MNNTLTPITEKQRHVILDALRGFALLGICLANLPEFGLWTFLSKEAQKAMPTAQTDEVVRFLQYVFVDAKFYCIFSILFGIGFSIILNNAQKRGCEKTNRKDCNSLEKGNSATLGSNGVDAVCSNKDDTFGSNGVRLFYRRMFVLLAIGVLHLLLMWSGDILALYAVVGMLLPLVRKLSDRKLLMLALVCLSIPVFLYAWQELSGISIADFVETAWWAKAHSYGITEENFASWLKDADSYLAVHQFLMQGAIERMYEFVDGHRFLKVFGLFVIGYIIGRNRLYARIAEFRHSISKVFFVTLAIGLPFSVLYAISATSGHCWGLTIHSFLYFISAYPTAFAYVTAFCLLYLNCSKPHLPTRSSRTRVLFQSFQTRFFRLLAKPGRMALTNYLSQSLFGIIIYYGIGFGLGLSMGLWQIELTAFAIFLFQIFLSHLWMLHFRYGPIEWLWRMLTYRRWLNPIRTV